MAGDWLKIEVCTPDKPEVWQVADALGIDPDAAFGKLFRVWSWFDAHTDSGNASTVTKKLLDRSVGVTGFCDAMISAGWMIEFDDEISLPNFSDHNGKTAKDRAATARRVAKHKASSKSGNDSANGKVTEQPLPTPLPREEKRREYGLPNGNPSAPTPSESPPEPALLIPTNRGDQFYPVYDDKIAEYRQTYPAIDVVQELRAARQWSIDNPNNRKTAGGMPKFLNGWLSRAQNKAPAVRTPQGGFKTAQQRREERSAEIRDYDSQTVF